MALYWYGVRPPEESAKNLADAITGLKSSDPNLRAQSWRGQRAKLTQLTDTFNRIPGRDRPRVVQEFTDYIRAEQNRQPLPRVGAGAAR